VNVGFHGREMEEGMVYYSTDPFGGQSIFTKGPLLDWTFGEVNEDTSRGTRYGTRKGYNFHPSPRSYSYGEEEKTEVIDVEMTHLSVSLQQQ
jgi:hypothetical protein